MKRTRNVVAVLILVLFAAGCATLSMNAKPWSAKTPKEKSTFFMAMYNSQFADTMTMASNPNITETQKQVVRTKKTILTKAWPLIQVYDSIAASGGVPTPDSEAAILHLINQLTTMAGGV